MSYKDVTTYSISVKSCNILKRDDKKIETFLKNKSLSVMDAYTYGSSYVKQLNNYKYDFIINPYPTGKHDTTGVDDYVVGQKYGLPVDNPVDDAGKFYDHLPLVGGLSAWKATGVVVREFTKNSLLLY